MAPPPSSLNGEPRTMSLSPATLLGSPPLQPRPVGNMPVQSPTAEDVTKEEAMTPPTPHEPIFGKDKYTRFEIELEFVQSLGNPGYISHLANGSTPYLTTPSFIAYLDYLQYWTKPPYIQYLQYPGPTLKALELLQKAEFRAVCGRPDVVARMMGEGVVAGRKGPGGAVAEGTGSEQGQSQSTGMATQSQSTATASASQSGTQSQSQSTAPTTQSQT